MHENNFVLARGPQSFFKEFRRAIRIFFEVLRGLKQLHNVGPCVTVFGSARFPQTHPYYEMTRQLGKAIAKAGFTVMTGGGPGLMEAANQGAKEAGGHSIGCNIRLPMEQDHNPYLDDWIEFRYFFVRKMMLAKYSYAFVAAPGGFGTIDELFEIATLIQTGKIKNFPVILFGTEYWGPLIEFLKTAVHKYATIAPKDLEQLIITDSPEEVAQIVHDCGTNHFGLYRKQSGP